VGGFPCRMTWYRRPPQGWEAPSRNWPPWS
jgi:hypothetical protein